MNSKCSGHGWVNQDLNEGPKGSRERVKIRKLDSSSDSRREWALSISLVAKAGEANMPIIDKLRNLAAIRKRFFYLSPASLHREIEAHCVWQFGSLAIREEARDLGCH